MRSSNSTNIPLLEHVNINEEVICAMVICAQLLPQRYGPSVIVRSLLAIEDAPNIITQASQNIYVCNFLCVSSGQSIYTYFFSLSVIFLPQWNRHWIAYYYYRFLMMKVWSPKTERALFLRYSQLMNIYLFIHFFFL